MKTIFLTIIICFSISLAAQDPELSFWNNIRNSAATQDGEVFIRCETIDLPNLNTSIFYLDEGEWAETEMDLISGLTYETQVPAPADQNQYCRFRTEHDTLVAMMPAYIENDIFPPVLTDLSEIDPDPSGDTFVESIPDLDIISTSFGYSDSRFYAALESSTGDYPLNNGGWIPSDYYLYMTGVINPENVLQDSVGYAMVYAEIPFVLYPGLYKISGLELNFESFQLIGDIETAEVDGQLLMSCDIETLTGDEDFGEWPSLSMSLGLDMITIQALDFINIELVDLGKASLQVIDNYQIEPWINQLPVLLDPEWEIVSNTTELAINYYDPDHNFPLTSQVQSGSELYQMIPQDFNYEDSVKFEAVIPETDWNQLTCRFSDNNIDFVELTVFNTPSSDYILTAGTELNVYPNPFNPVTSLKFDLAMQAQVKLDIFNIRGELVTTLVDMRLDPGIHSFTWNADQRESGLYLYQLRVADRKTTGKMILVK